MFIFYQIALVSGAVAFGQTITIYLRYRKVVIWWYGAFLLCLYLFLMSFYVEVYGSVAGVAQTRAVANLYWLFQAAGGIGYVVVAPRFYHSLLGRDFGPAKKLFFGVYLVVVVLLALVYVAAPDLIPVAVSLNLLLFAMIAYGLVLMALGLRAIADPDLRRAIGVFLGLSVFFFPLFYFDVLISNVEALAPLAELDGLSLPAYFSVLSGLSIAFALRYLNKPAYSDGDAVTPFFAERFGVTEREVEIIELALGGASNKDIGEVLFISPKTVENHLYNIYQKLNVKNRGQMSQLIRSNT